MASLTVADDGPPDGLSYDTNQSIVCPGSVVVELCVVESVPDLVIASSPAPLANGAVTNNEHSKPAVTNATNARRCHGAPDEGPSTFLTRAPSATPGRS